MEVATPSTNGGNPMIPPEPLVFILVKLINRIPMSPPPSKRRRGHPTVYPDRLFLQALVIMIVRHLHQVHELPTVLDEENCEMQTLRTLLIENGRYPSRRTWERRLKTIPETLPAQIGCLGRHLVSLMQPWQSSGRAGAIDSTVLRAAGGVWHKKDREQGVVPHTSIDTEAAWTQSGWHGWVYGWKLHLIAAVATVWIPLAALLTPANTADNEAALALIREVPPDMRFLLGDRHYNAPNVREAWENDGHILVAYQHRPRRPWRNVCAGRYRRNERVEANRLDSC
jgi:transposase